MSSLASCVLHKRSRHTFWLVKATNISMGRCCRFIVVWCGAPFIIAARVKLRTSHIIFDENSNDWNERPNGEDCEENEAAGKHNDLIFDAICSRWQFSVQMSISDEAVRFAAEDAWNKFDTRIYVPLRDMTGFRSDMQRFINTKLTMIYLLRNASCPKR